MIRKGVYSYDYMDGLGNFEETNYSNLNMKSVSDNDYEYTQHVCNTMEKKGLGCYHDTYLKADLLLLVDVF